jgi:hypothetical protein
MLILSFLLWKLENQHGNSSDQLSNSLLERQREGDVGVGLQLILVDVALQQVDLEENS